MAFSRASVRWLAPCERLSLITSKEAPTIPRCCLTVRRVRFFATSYFWNILDYLGYDRLIHGSDEVVQE